VVRVSFWTEEVPGFAVGVVEAGAAVAAAAEQEAGDSEGGVQRNEVPGVFGDDVDGEEMDFAGKVGDGASVEAAMGVDAVEAVAELGGTFHLDAPEGRGEVGRKWRDFGRWPAPGRVPGRVVCARPSYGRGGNTRFLHCAVAFAPAPVGMTKFKGARRPGGALVGMTMGERCVVRRARGATRSGTCGVCSFRVRRRRTGEIAGVEDDVVAFAVAEGASYAEAEAGGFEDEGEFGEFSAALGVEFPLVGSLGEELCGG
jgi:hypothetical protein